MDDLQREIYSEIDSAITGAISNVSKRIAERIESDMSIVLHDGGNLSLIFVVGHDNQAQSV